MSIASPPPLLPSSVRILNPFFCIPPVTGRSPLSTAAASLSDSSVVGKLFSLLLPSEFSQLPSSPSRICPEALEPISK